MAYETIVAAFDTPEHAQAAIKALKAGGFHGDDISIFDRNRLTAGGAAIRQGVKEAGLWRRLFGSGLHEHEATVFGQTVSEGGTVISLRVLDSEVAHATGILDVHRPIDIHDRAITSGVAPPNKVEAVAKEVAATPLMAPQRIATSPKAAAVHDEVLRLAEEQLQVGKEMVETGRTRVRRFTTEREVAQDVTLHDEHAEVLRRAVAEPASFQNVDWSDSELEVVETTEHALARKTARVVEEIELKKVGSDHVETIHERLRRQQAEVLRTDPRGAPMGDRPAAH
jgi:stress response protein YsnF